MSRPTVLHVIRTGLRPTESFVPNQLEHLREYEPVVLSHREFKGGRKWPGSHVMTSELLRPWERQLDSMAYALARSVPPPTVSAVRAYVNKLHPDVIHIHFLVDAAFFVPVLQGMGIPIVVSGYGYDVSSFPRALLGLGARYLRRSFRATSLFLAMSEDMKRDMLRLGIPDSKVRVHYFGIDVRRFPYEERQSAGSRPFRILITGRLVPKKGHAVLLRALQILRDSSHGERSFELRVVGDGPLHDHLVRLSRELSLSQHVHFAGHLQYGGPAILSEHSSADLFVLPSMRAGGDKEGIPGALLEAMASGLPVVSTFHAGIPEIIEDGIHGLLVPEGDAGALANAIGRYMEDEPLRRRLANAGASRATEFDIRKRTAHLELLYKTLTPRGHATGLNDG